MYVMLCDIFNAIMMMVLDGLALYRGPSCESLSSSAPLVTYPNERCVVIPGDDGGSELASFYGVRSADSFNQSTFLEDLSTGLSQTYLQYTVTGMDDSRGNGSSVVTEFILFAMEEITCGQYPSADSEDDEVMYSMTTCENGNVCVYHD